MDKHYTVYGDAGSGSVPVEAALNLIKAPYEVIGGDVVRDVSRNESVIAVNPLSQVPTLVLPTGEVITESAAILIYLADRHPDVKLGPAVGDGQRPHFLRWMIYVSTAIYGLAWVRADPTRLVSDERQIDIVRNRIGERRAECWRQMDRQIAPDRFLLGDELSVLDLYVATVSRWLPRRQRFYHEAPKMAEIVRRVDNEPRLTEFWAERFPFSKGWEE